MSMARTVRAFAMLAAVTAGAAAAGIALPLCRLGNGQAAVAVWPELVGVNTSAPLANVVIATAQYTAYAKRAALANVTDAPDDCARGGCRGYGQSVYADSVLLFTRLVRDHRWNVSLPGVVSACPASSNTSSLQWLPIRHHDVSVYSQSTPAVRLTTSSVDDLPLLGGWAASGGLLALARSQQLDALLDAAGAAAAAACGNASTAAADRVWSLEIASGAPWAVEAGLLGPSAVQNASACGIGSSGAWSIVPSTLAALCPFQQFAPQPARGALWPAPPASGGGAPSPPPAPAERVCAAGPTEGVDAAAVVAVAGAPRADTTSNTNHDSADNINNTTVPFGALHVGALHPAYAAHIKWSQTLQDGTSLPTQLAAATAASVGLPRLLAPVYDVSVCGVSLLSNATGSMPGVTSTSAGSAAGTQRPMMASVTSVGSATMSGAYASVSHWLLEVDSLSTCTRLPAPMFDVLMRWVPADCSSGDDNDGAAGSAAGETTQATNPPVSSSRYFGSRTCRVPADAWAKRVALAAGSSGGAVASGDDAAAAGFPWLTLHLRSPQQHGTDADSGDSTLHLPMDAFLMPTTMITGDDTGGDIMSWCILREPTAFDDGTSGMAATVPSAGQLHATAPIVNRIVLGASVLPYLHVAWDARTNRMGFVSKAQLAVELAANASATAGGQARGAVAAGYGAFAQCAAPVMAAAAASDGPSCLAGEAFIAAGNACVPPPCSAFVALGLALVSPWNGAGGDAVAACRMPVVNLLAVTLVLAALPAAAVWLHLRRGALATLVAARGVEQRAHKDSRQARQQRQPLRPAAGAGSDSD